MSWLLIVGGAWSAVAVPLALLIGRGISRADQLAQPAVPDFVPTEWSAVAPGSR